MPMTVSNPRDLILTVLADLLFVEREQAFEVLPDLLKEVSDSQLSHVLADHLEVTKRHARDLEDVFRAIQSEPSSDHSFAFAGMQEQRSSRAGSIVTLTLKDIFNATAARPRRTLRDSRLPNPDRAGRLDRRRRRGDRAQAEPRRRTGRAHAARADDRPALAVTQPAEPVKHSARL